MFKYLFLIFIFFLSAMGSYYDDLVSFGGFFLGFDRIVFLSFVFSIFLFLSSSKEVFFSLNFSTPLVLFLFFFLLQCVFVFFSPDIVYSVKRWINSLINYIAVLSVLIYIYSFLIKDGFELFIFRMNGSLIFFFSVSLFFVFLFSVMYYLSPSLFPKVYDRDFLGFSFYRAYFPFKDPNFLGMYISICCCFLYSLIGKCQYSSFFLNMNIVVGFIILLMTGSRASLITTMIVMALVRYRGFFISLFNKSLFSLLIIVLPVISLIFVLYNFDSVLFTAIQYDNAEESGLARLYSWYSAWSLIKDNPFVGIGPGNYVTMEKGYYLSNYLPLFKAEKFNGLAAHSNYMEVLVESGILGLICYVSIFSCVLVNLFFCKKSEISSYFTIVMIFMINTMLLSNYYLWYFFLFGICIAMSTISKDVDLS